MTWGSKNKIEEMSEGTWIAKTFGKNKKKVRDIMTIRQDSIVMCVFAVAAMIIFGMYILTWWPELVV